MQQCIISMVGALFIIPTSLFFGGMFSFAFGTQQSLGGWLFGLTAFWCQILGIVASFFKPRLAAVWMLLNIAVSILVSAGTMHLSMTAWLRACPGYLKATSFFWAGPLVVALLLLRPRPADKEQTQPLTEMEG
jgi:hypothetical protein